MGETRFRNIPLESLKLPRPAVRRVRERFEQLRSSIDQVGLLVPLLVRALEDGRYLVLAGAGRVAALRAQGVAPSHEVPCAVVEGEKRDAALVAIAENVAREPLKPFDLAKLVRALLRDYAYSQRRIAAVLGKSEGLVSQLLAVFDLDPAALEALGHNQIQMKTAQALLALRDDRRAQRRLLRQIVKEQLDSAQARALIAAYVHGAKALAPGRYEIEKVVTIDARTTRRGRLRITIEARDREALRRLLGAAPAHLRL